MRRRTMLWCTALMLLAAATSQTGAAPARGPNPERIAHHCAERVAALADRCVEHNAQAAEECVVRINELLEAGEEQQARRLAQQCVRRIARHSDRCVEQIHRHCERCIQTLLELGADDLAERLRAHCAEQVAKVRRSQRAAIGAIRAALSGPDEGASAG